MWPPTWPPSPTVRASRWRSTTRCGCDTSGLWRSCRSSRPAPWIYQPGNSPAAPSPPGPPPSATPTSDTCSALRTSVCPLGRAGGGVVGVGGDFAARIDELADKVGHGSLVGKDEVDQYYAGYVHEILRYHHPVGNAKFLERPLHANAATYFSKIGEHILEGGGALAMVGATQQ